MRIEIYHGMRIYNKDKNLCWVADLSANPPVWRSIRVPGYVAPILSPRFCVIGTGWLTDDVDPFDHWVKEVREENELLCWNGT